MSSGLWRLAAREAHLPTLPLASALRGGAAVDAARALGALRRASRGVHRLRGRGHAQGRLHLPALGQEGVCRLAE